MKDDCSFPGIPLFPCGLGLGEHTAALGGDLVTAATTVPACFLLHKETELSTIITLLLVTQHVSAEVILSQGLGNAVMLELFSTGWTLAVLCFFQSPNDVCSKTLLPFLPHVFPSLVLC